MILTILLRLTPEIYRDYPRPTFSLVLRKEYFDCPQRDSHAMHYILKRGERGVCTFVLCSLATVMSCIDASVRIVTKSPKVGPLLIFSISLVDPPAALYTFWSGVGVGVGVGGGWRVVLMCEWLCRGCNGQPSTDLWSADISHRKHRCNFGSINVWNGGWVRQKKLFISS
jgi:hypothetical protein